MVNKKILSKIRKQINGPLPCVPYTAEQLNSTGISWQCNRPLKFSKRRIREMEKSLRMFKKLLDKSK